MVVCEQGKRPDAPEEVVQEAAVQDLSLQLRVVFGHVLVFLVVVFIFLIWIHVLSKVLPHVLLDHLLLLILGHQVVSVFLHAILSWMSVVDHCFVDVDGKVHCHWVPTSILIVDDEKVPVVSKTHEDIVLMNVVVAKHCWEGVG